MENVSFHASSNLVTTRQDGDGYDLDYVYDGLHRVTQITHPDSTTESFDYTTTVEMTTYYYPDVQAYTDREGNVTEYVYNANRQLVEKVQASGSLDIKTPYGWCSCGDLEWLQDGNQVAADTDSSADPDERTTWHRDLHGRVTSKEFEDGKKYTYEYEDESGLLASVWYPVDHSGSPQTKSGTATVTHKYFKDGNLQKVDYRNSSTPDVTYTYDSDYNRIATRADGAGTWTYTFNAIDGSGTGDGMLGSITNTLWSDSDLDFTYDNLGRVATRTVATGDDYTEHWMEWNYDSLGRISSVDTNLGETDEEFDYVYLSDSSPLVDYVKYPNSSTESSKFRADYAYETEGNGRFLKQIKNDKVSASSNPYSQFDYTHSDGGQIIDWTREINQSGSGETHTHAYDDAYRLTEATDSGPSYDFDYVYDAANNRTQSEESGAARTFYTDDRNRLTSSSGGGETDYYTYDANGNLTLGYNYQGRKNTTYTWDDINRLIKIQTDADGDFSFESGDKQAEFAYDGLSRRYRAKESTHNGTTWALDRTDYFLWAGNDIVQKRVDGTSEDDVKNNYYPMGESRHTSGSNKTDYYYTLDHLGSIRELLDSSGNIKSSYEYTPYGTRTQLVTSGALEVDFGFTGHWFHERSGLYLAMFRAYDANLGRWISQDPLGEMIEQNLFSYVGNGPIVMNDPLGLFSLKQFARYLGGAVFVGVGAKIGIALGAPLGATVGAGIGGAIGFGVGVLSRSPAVIVGSTAVGVLGGGAAGTTVGGIVGGSLGGIAGNELFNQTFGDYDDPLKGKLELKPGGEPNENPADGERNKENVDDPAEKILGQIAPNALDLCSRSVEQEARLSNAAGSL